MPGSRVIEGDYNIGPPVFDSFYNPVSGFKNKLGRFIGVGVHIDHMQLAVTTECGAYADFDLI